MSLLQFASDANAEKALSRKCSISIHANGYQPQLLSSNITKLVSHNAAISTKIRVKQRSIQMLGLGLVKPYKNLLVCESGLPVPDMVTVVKPEDEVLVAWFMLWGTVTPGGG